MKQNKQITVFKIRITNITSVNVTFDLYVADRVDDTTYVNAKRIGGYTTMGMIVLGCKQFSDFAQRLIAYVYLQDEFYISDSILKCLWELKLNIFDKENPKKATSIFIKYRSKLKKLKLTR